MKEIEGNPTGSGSVQGAGSRQQAKGTRKSKRGKRRGSVFSGIGEGSDDDDGDGDDENDGSYGVGAAGERERSEWFLMILVLLMSVEWWRYRIVDLVSPFPFFLFRTIKISHTWSNT